MGNGMKSEVVSIINDMTPLKLVALFAAEKKAMTVNINKLDLE
jgi:hypothetical protein